MRCKACNEMFSPIEDEMELCRKCIDVINYTEYVYDKRYLLEEEIEGDKAKKPLSDNFKYKTYAKENMYDP